MRRINATETLQTDPITVLLTTVATAMRDYDTVRAQLAPLQVEAGTFDSEVEQALEVLDLNTPLQQQPQHIAYASLGAHIARQKAEPLQTRKYAIERSLQSFRTDHFLRKRVRVTSTDPEKYFMGTSKENKYGQHDGMSLWHDSRVGKIVELVLHPESSHLILQDGWRNRQYTADPLIDRQNDYQPAFTITML